MKTNLLCKIFKHNYIYSMSNIECPITNIRVCKICHSTQVFVNFGGHRFWTQTVVRTKHGVEQCISNKEFII